MIKLQMLTSPLLEPDGKAGPRTWRNFVRYLFREQPTETVTINNNLTLHFKSFPFSEGQLQLINKMIKNSQSQLQQEIENLQKTDDLALQNESMDKELQKLKSLFLRLIFGIFGGIILLFTVLYSLLKKRFTELEDQLKKDYEAVVET